ncbi:MAG: hypothetical protein U5L04_01250 [Trueperaceae bacterium]|nr:hypothetical protein [Trueperaceae bacterium]
MIIESESKRYVFEKLSKQRILLPGLEERSGDNFTGKKKGTHRDRIRKKLAEKHRR